MVGLKAAKSELRRLRKEDGDVRRNKSTRVVKNNFRMVKDLITEKIGIEVSSSVLAALVAEDDVALLEGAADADVEVLVPPAVLVDAISATVEGSGVLVFADEVCAVWFSSGLPRSSQ